MRTQFTAAALVAVMILSVVAVGTAGFGVVGAASEEVQTVPHTGGSELQPESTSGTVGPGLEDASGETSALVFLEPADVGSEMTPEEVQEKLQAQAEDTQPAVTSQLDDMGVDVRNGFWIVNALVVTYDADELTAEQIASVEGVRLVAKNSETHPPDPIIDQQEVTPQGDSTYGLEQINATTVWDEFGTQGDGGVVVIQDNGFDVDHEALDFEEAHRFDSDGNKVGDPGVEDHGTHVAGTAAGGEDPSGTAIGVAPDAELHGHDIFGSGVDTVGASIGSMEIAVEEDADVVSGSWGSGCHTFFPDPVYNDEQIDPIHNVQLLGTAVISSTGNDGEGCVSGFGNDHESLGIGASAENESVANFSSGGLIDKDDGQPDWPDAGAWDDPSEDWPQSWVEPRVSAPGVSVYSSLPGDQYTDGFSGTSMAAPHVAGAIALIQAATDGNFTGPEIREALVETAWKPDDWDEDDARWTNDNVTMDQPGIDSRYGHGIIDVGAAITLLEPEAFFDVSIDETTSPITEGDTLTVNATIENTGTAEDTQVIELDAEELGNDSVVATVDPNDSTQIPFFVETSEGDAGDYTATLSSQDDSDSTTVTVVEPAFLDVTIDETNSPVTEGETLEINTTIENTGGDEGVQQIELDAGNLGNHSAFVTLDSNESTEETFTLETTEGDAGDYTATLSSQDDSDSTTVEVVEPAFFHVSIDETNSPVSEGETLEINTTIVNTGGEEDTQTIELDAG